MRFGSRQARLAALKGWGKAVSLRYDIRRSAAIFATGRGGSTWFAEILTAVPGSILQWEPLHPKSNPTAVRLGFERRPYFTDAHPPTPRQMRFLRGVFDGSMLNFETATLHQTPPPTLRDFLRFRRFVAKFVNANASIDWITRTFGIRSFLLLRHPCAVIASQNRFGWSRPAPDMISPALLRDFPILGEIRARAATREEQLALAWIVGALPPLAIPAERRSWSTVFYEDLVREPERSIGEAYRWLGEEVPPAVGELHGRPSAMVKDSVQGLEAWRTQLDADQQRRILRLVAEAGITVYGDAPTPQRG